MQRHKDIKNGLSARPEPTLANMINPLTKSRCCPSTAGTSRREFGNIVGHVKGVAKMGELSAWTAQQFGPKFSWADMQWINSAGAAS